MGQGPFMPMQGPGNEPKRRQECRRSDLRGTRVGNGMASARQGRPSAGRRGHSRPITVVQAGPGPREDIVADVTRGIHGAACFDGAFGQPSRAVSATISHHKGLRAKSQRAALQRDREIEGSRLHLALLWGWGEEGVQNIRLSSASKTRRLCLSSFFVCVCVGLYRGECTSGHTRRPNYEAPSN